MEIKRLKAQDYFNQFVKEYERFPTLEEWYQIGYKKASYYICKKNYNPMSQENEK